MKSEGGGSLITNLSSKCNEKIWNNGTDGSTSFIKRMYWRSKSIRVLPRHFDDTKKEWCSNDFLFKPHRRIVLIWSLCRGPNFFPPGPQNRFLIPSFDIFFVCFDRVHPSSSFSDPLSYRRQQQKLYVSAIVVILAQYCINFGGNWSYAVLW